MNVTVLIPTYNYANYILDAIKSIENQTYPLDLIEIVIIDDGSTDDTQAVLEAYDSCLTVRYYCQENKGKAIATQLGIDKSEGEIIFNLDADDYFYPNKIKAVVEIYKSRSEVVSVGHPAKIVYQNDLKEAQETIPLAISDSEKKGCDVLEFFLDNRILFGGGSTFSARANTLKSISVAEGVDMYIDEYLIFGTYAQGSVFLLNSHLSVWRVHGKNYSVGSEKSSVQDKVNRLISSSKWMLKFVERNIALTDRVKELYFLKHLDRYYSSLETCNDKRIPDVLKLIKLMMSGKHNFKDLNNYRLFNRLIPTFIINKLKA